MTACSSAEMTPAIRYWRRPGAGRLMLAMLAMLAAGAWGQLDPAYTMYTSYLMSVTQTQMAALYPIPTTTSEVMYSLPSMPTVSVIPPTYTSPTGTMPTYTSPTDTMPTYTSPADTPVSLLQVFIGATPPDEPDLNDQGIWDARRDLIVYTGLGGVFDPWTHHLDYHTLATAWEEVLLAKPEIQQVAATNAIAAFEIRYWYDSLPGPVTADAHWVVTTEDQRLLAHVYALSAAAREARLYELQAQFGRPVLLTPVSDRSNEQVTSSAAATVVDGCLVSPGVVMVGKDGICTDGVYSGDAPKGAGTYVDCGPVPPAKLAKTTHHKPLVYWSSCLPPYLPVLPSDDNLYYGVTPFLEDAWLQPAGDFGVGGRLSLGGGTLLVNGTFTLAAGGEIAGPGTIVATERLDLGERCRIGDGVVLIALAGMSIGDASTLGRGLILYGLSETKIGKQCAVGSASLISVLNVEIGEGTHLGGGLVMSSEKVDIKKGSRLTAGVVAGIRIKVD